MCVRDAENGTHWLCVLREVDVSVCVFVCWLAVEVAVPCVCVCACVRLYYFIGVTEQLSFLNECNYVINN